MLAEEIAPIWATVSLATSSEANAGDLGGVESPDLSAAETCDLSRGEAVDLRGAQRADTCCA